MCVGEQWLRDSGYSANLDFDEDNEDEEMKEGTDIEVQLAPWVITRNFLQAAAVRSSPTLSRSMKSYYIYTYIQGKGMLKLYGAGDPTGIGEGFSFVRASMKEMFYKSNENAEERMGELLIGGECCYNLSYPPPPKKHVAQDRAKYYHKFSIAEQQHAYREEVRIYNFTKTLKITENPPIHQ